VKKTRHHTKKTAGTNGKKTQHHKKEWPHAEDINPIMSLSGVGCLSHFGVKGRMILFGRVPFSLAGRM